MVDMLVTGDGEAAAFPATEVRKRFVLESGNLRESTSENMGGLSALDLQDSEWKEGDPANQIAEK